MDLSVRAETISTSRLSGQTAAILLLVVTAVLVPRLMALDRFVTPDEAAWVGRSASFYYALAHHDFAGTFQHSHPGVTATWAGALAFRLRYPGLAWEADAKVAKNWKNVEPFLREHGVSPLEVLKTARTFMVLGTALALAIAFLEGVRLAGLLPASIGFALIAFDPFYAGLTRLLHLDGLMAGLMLLALLAFMNYLYRGRRLADLGLATIATGLSWLTKSPSLFLLPFFGLLVLIELLKDWRNSGTLRIGPWWSSIWPLAALGTCAAGLFVLLWPSVWVKPFWTIGQVIGQSLSYAAEGHDSVIFFDGRIVQGDPGWLFYPVNYLWRATPATLVGLVLGILAFSLRIWPFDSDANRRSGLILALYAFAFAAVMSAGAKKFDRYLIPSFLPLDLLAGFGWAGALVWGWKARGLLARTGILAIIAAAISSQVYLAASTYPYYLSYYNPLMGGSRKAPEVMMIGWGEGLDQAARYLDSLPGVERLRVMSHYPDGSFSYFFEGETIAQIDHWEGLESSQFDNVDYFVLYDHQLQRQQPDRELLAYFESQTPEYIVRINGLEYARVYNLHQ